MTEFRAAAGGMVAAGEAYFADTPMLSAHAGTQPDLFLRWNEIPCDAAAVDVVVHLHGFSRAGAAMALAEKVARSGLDLAGRRRPTLAVLPRGNWLRYSWYDHPAMLAGGLDRLVEHALARFAGSVPGGLEIDRLILTAHSGGGMPAIDAIADARRAPDELHLFDGLYGRDPAAGDPLRGIETIEDWLGQRLAREPERPGALRIVFIEQQTGPFSRRVGDMIARHLSAAAPQLAARYGAELRRRYRVEPSTWPHARIAERCGPDLLAAADAEFDRGR